MSCFTIRLCRWRDRLMLRQRWLLASDCGVSAVQAHAAVRQAGVERLCELPQCSLTVHNERALIRSGDCAVRSFQ